MGRAGIGRRLAGLEAAARARAAASDPTPTMLILFPDGWSPADRAAFDGDDEAARWNAITRATGLRPGPRTLLIVFPERPDGPQ